MLRLGAGGFQRLVLGVHLLVFPLVRSGARRLWRLLVQIENAIELAQSGAQIPGALGVHCRPVETFFLAFELLMILLQALHLRQKLRRLRLAGAEFENTPERFPRRAERPILKVRTRDAKPTLDIPISAPRVDFGLERQRLGVLWIQLHRLIDLLKRELILLLFHTGSRCLDELRYPSFGPRPLNQGSQLADLRIEMAFRFQFANYFTGVIVIALIVGLMRPLQTWQQAGRIEYLNRLVM